MRVVRVYVYLLLLAPFFLLLSENGRAQDAPVRWKRSDPLTTVDLQLFLALQSVNLPTAETLQRGDIEFQILHRFIPAVSKGVDALFGLDGPANMRFALTYAPTNRILVTVGRSNVFDNTDLFVKYKFLQIRNDSFPLLFALKGGVAWNTQVFIRKKSDSKNFQYFGQFIVNTLIKKKIGLGIVPSYLNNSDIFSANNEHSLTFGSYAQYYVSSTWSILIEWNSTVSGWRSMHNPVTLGVELNTGGHFFKLIMTNSVLLNTSQFLGGSEYKFSNNDLRLGFNISRLFRFK